MALNISNIVIDDFKKILGRKISTGEINFILSQVESPSLQCDADEIVKTDAHDTPISRWYQAKTAEFSAESVLLDFNLLSWQLNGEDKIVASTENTQNAPAIEEHTFTSSSELTEYTLANAAINESTSTTPVYRISVSLLNKDGSLKKNFAVGSAADENTCTYTSNTKKLTFAEGAIAVGDKLFVAYEYVTSNATVVYNQSDKTPKAMEMWAEFIGHDVCDPDTVYVGYCVFPKATLSPSTTVNFGREENFEFSFSAEQDYCDDKKQLFRIVMVENATA